MANSLKIYKTQLTPARNALLDDIEGYLANVENRPDYYTGEDELVYANDDFQYVKPDLDVTIRIDLPINNDRMFDSVGNYARIEQSQGGGKASIWYYFIIGSKWTAQSTLELTLSLDTVNTFGEYLLDEGNWSDKTNIIREHEDQLDVIGDSSGFKLVQRVDRQGENISVPYYIKTEDDKIEEPNSTGTPEWYLVYQTENAAISEGSASASSNPLKCYIYPKTSILYQQQSGTSSMQFTRTPTDFPDGKIYGITSGGVSFDDVRVYFRYFDYKTKILLKTIEGTNTNNPKLYKGDSLTISGHVDIGDKFTDYKGTIWTCESIVWYKEKDVTGDAGRMNLPLGVFTSNKSSDKYYCLYLTKVNNDVINSWFIAKRYVDYTNKWKGEAILDDIKDTSDSSAYGKLLKDTSATSDNWFISSYDTNWARNAIYLTAGTFTFKVSTQYIYSIDYYNATPTSVQLTNGTKFYTNGTAGTSDALSCIDFLDRTDSRLVKIIALPYCPTEITISNGSIASGDFTISFDNKILDLVSETADGYTNYKRLKYKADSPVLGKDLNKVLLDYSYTRNLVSFFENGYMYGKKPENEPKLNASAFTLDHFVYDDVYKNIRREDLTASGDSVAVTPYFRPTNTIGSDMLYKFSIDGGNYEESADWELSMVSKRNNEVPIYNNDYLNYIRYGYKTEKENLQASAEAQRTAATVNTVLGVGGSVLGGAAAGAVAGVKYGGIGAIPGAIIGAVVGLGTSIAKSASSINTMETNIQNAQRSLQSKVEQLQNSASSTKGGSAVDLMTGYTGNRLHYMQYTMPPLLKEAVYDKFYYCGYSHPVQEKPNLDNRYLFNFVQCEPVFSNEATKQYAHYVEDIKERFRIGVTVYHDVGHNLKNSDTSELMYDWAQQYENWYFNKDFKIALSCSLNENYQSDNRYQVTISYAIDNPLFKPTASGFKYLVEGLFEGSLAWKTLFSNRHSETPIKFTNGSGPIPTKLRFTLKNNNLGWKDDKSFEVEVKKPALCTLKSPTVVVDRFSTDVSLSSDYEIGANTGIYYQMRMVYDNSWTKYPYYYDEDYANDYTARDTCQLAMDLNKRGYVLDNLNAVCVRVYNVNTGEYSDWTYNTIAR